MRQEGGNDADRQTEVKNDTDKSKKRFTTRPRPAPLPPILRPPLSSSLPPFCRPSDAVPTPQGFSLTSTEARTRLCCCCGGGGVITRQEKEEEGGVKTQNKLKQRRLVWLNVSPA